MDAVASISCVATEVTTRSRLRGTGSSDGTCPIWAAAQCLGSGRHQDCFSQCTPMRTGKHPNFSWWFGPGAGHELYRKSYTCTTTWGPANFEAAEAPEQPRRPLQMPVASSVKRWLAPVIKTAAPRVFWRRKYGILQRLGESIPDVQLARSLCDPNRVSLDIGASIGEFTIAMLGSSRSVIAFEPRPAQAHELAEMFEAVGAPVRVESMALSDQPGVTAMRVVESDPGRSTIDDNNTLGDLAIPAAVRSRPSRCRCTASTTCTWTTSAWSRSTSRATNSPCCAVPRHPHPQSACGAGGSRRTPSPQCRRRRRRVLGRSWLRRPLRRR